MNLKKMLGLEKFCENPKEKSRRIYIPQWANKFAQRLMLAASIFVATKMQSQQSDIFPKNKMNLIESEAETRGAASAIIDRVRQKDSITTRAFRGSVDTQYLMAHTTIIPNTTSYRPRYRNFFSKRH